MQSPRDHADGRPNSQQQHTSLAEHDALPLVLQHSSLTQHLRAICALIATSNALAEAVAHACRGALHVAFGTRSLQHATHWSHWLARWAGLARSVELEWTHVNLCDVEAAIAAALQRAAEPDDGDAAAPGPGSCRAGPLLCTCVKANVMGPLLLAHLPASSLTCLELGHVVDYAQGGAVDEALAKLTGLQSLTVLTPRSFLVLPATSALTRLTHACILLKDLQANGPLLRHLPPQLRQLELSVAWALGAAGSGVRGAHSRPPLPLRHISGLQELRCSGYMSLQADDELPPRLASLQAPDCHAVAPLLHLSSLRWLNLYNCTTPAAELAKLGQSLRQLSELTLGYFGAEESPTLDAAAPGWPGLPLRSLDLDSNCGECHVGARALEALGRLGSSLTQLSLSGGIELETHCTGLAGVLARLTRLHTLRLAAVELLLEEAPQQQRWRQAQRAEAPAGAPHAEPAPATAAASPAAAAAAAAVPMDVAHSRLSGAQQVLVAVAGLASLRSLKLGSLSSWLAHPAQDLQPLCAATHLTCLHIMDLGVCDGTVERLAAHLTQLRALDISDNARVSDAALGALRASLPLLLNLDVSGTGVTPEGIRALCDALPSVAVVCFDSSDDDML